MDRLKKEWEKAQIPEELRVRSRNLAWNKIQSPVPGRRRYAWIAAISTTAVAIIILVTIRNGRETQLQQVTALRGRETSQFIDSTASPKTQSVDSASLPKVAPARRSSRRKPGKTVADQYERVVLNFRLPESGTQMIWILDSRFQLDGGAQ